MGWLAAAEPLLSGEGVSVSKAKPHLTITTAPCWAPPVYNLGCFLCHSVLFQYINPISVREKETKGEEDADRVSLQARCGLHKVYMNFLSCAK